MEDVGHALWAAAISGRLTPGRERDRRDRNSGLFNSVPSAMTPSRNDWAGDAVQQLALLHLFPPRYYSHESRRRSGHDFKKEIGKIRRLVLFFCKIWRLVQIVPANPACVDQEDSRRNFLYSNV